MSRPRRPSHRLRSEAKAISPDRCFSRSPPSRSSGRSGWSSGGRSRRRISTTTPSCAPAAAGGFPNTTIVSSSVRWPIIWPRPGAPRDRRFRCPRPARPARPRSSLASKRSAAARPRQRCALRPTVRSIRKRWCGFRCCRRCRPRTIRRKPRPNHSPRTATVSSWRKAPARWCWKATMPRSPAARRFSAWSPAAAS